MYIEAEGPDRLLHVGSGTYYKFEPDGDGFKEVSAPGVNAKGGRYFLEAQGNNLVVHIRHGGRYDFEPYGSNNRYRLTAVYDKRGEKLTVNYASGNNHISTIVSAAGNVFAFTYSSDQLTQVRDETGNRTASFDYQGNLLASVTDMGGQKFDYAYDASGGLTSVVPHSASGEYEATVITYTGCSTGGSPYSVEILYPDGGFSRNTWGGFQGSTMDVDYGNGLAFKTSYGWEYSSGPRPSTIAWLAGPGSGLIFCDGTGTAAVDGKAEREEEVDGTITAYTYNQYGDITSIVRADATEALIRSTTNIYTFFPGTWEPQTEQTEVRDGSGKLLSKSLLTYTNNTRETADLWDDVYMLVSERKWFGPGETDYGERRYTSRQIS